MPRWTLGWMAPQDRLQSSGPCRHFRGSAGLHTPFQLCPGATHRPISSAKYDVSIAVASPIVTKWPATAGRPEGFGGDGDGEGVEQMERLGSSHRNGR